MKLLTKEIINKMPGPRAQENESDPMVYAKFFSCRNNWTWYAYEGWKYLIKNGTFHAEVPLNYELKEGESFEKDDNGEDVVVFFGRVHGYETELGAWQLNEHLEVNRNYMLGVERDIHFKPRKLSECK